MMAGPGDVTRLLEQWREGDAQAVDRLLPLVYEELRRLSAAYLRRERGNHTLQPTALVHEAYLRLVGKDHPQWHGRVHFLAVASQQMRRILVDHARSHGAVKRGGEVEVVPFDEAVAYSQDKAATLLALDEALTALAEVDERKARIIELRYFAGLTLEEAAELLGVSTATVNNESRFARAWLRRFLR